MTVYLVGAGPGDPGLLTRRGADLLARADVVLHDRLVSRAVLDLAGPDAQMIDVGKEPDAAADPEARGRRQEERQAEIARLLVEHGRRGSVVVRLKGGDPFLFGRGGEEIEVLERAGIEWEVVPGVTSAFGVPGVVGIPVTQRGLATTVTVVTGRVGDHLASADESHEPDWGILGALRGTLVVLMGMSTRAAIAQALIEGGRDPDTPVAVIARGTTPDEAVVRTTLRGLANVDLGPPAVIVVGPVAAFGAGTGGTATAAPA
jgi:uroporphyrin-III C-methyltransferase